MGQRPGITSNLSGAFLEIMSVLGIACLRTRRHRSIEDVVMVTSRMSVQQRVR